MQVKNRKKQRRGLSEHPLKTIRTIAGLTLQELAQECGISASYISRLESGERRLNLEIMEKVSKALKCSPSDLIPNRSVFKSDKNNVTICGSTNSFTKTVVVKVVVVKVSKGDYSFVDNLIIYHDGGVSEGMMIEEAEHFITLGNKKISKENIVSIYKIIGVLRGEQQND